MQHPNPEDTPSQPPRRTPLRRALHLALAVLALLLTLLLGASPTLLLYWQILQRPVADLQLPTDLEPRKADFVRQLLPAIQQNNRHLLAQRAALLAARERLQRQRPLRRRTLDTLQELGERYRLPMPDSGADLPWLDRLLMRVDQVPASIALSQAALESAWGRSRFAEEGNNFFGQWCFEPGCGMVPARRPAGARYEVARFASVEEAVERYMLNLNSHPRYKRFRTLRSLERARGGDRLDGDRLAEGLMGYAEIGGDYVNLVRSVMRSNRFQQYPDV